MKPSILLTSVLVFTSAAPVALLAASTPFFGTTFATTTAKPLNGTGPDQPADSAGAWIASPNLELHSEDGRGFVSVKNAGSFIGKVALPSDTTPATIVVEAALKAVSATGSQCWVGLGLGNPPTDKVNSTWSQGGLLLLLNTKGEIECHLSGAKLILLKRVRVPGYDPEKPTTLRLSYNAAQQTLSASANETVVVSEYELANHDFTPDAKFAGISGYGQKPGTDLVNSFKIEIQR
ncbi:hypothetical protein OPIT5_24370 [Opitutaceae bacterium TAV5]|nr:hypothetical protein OPIT5_24370 [Opitutaceae bacterium TAV5]